jgi:hypothetical protein
MKKNILITLVFIALCFNAYAIEYTWTWTGASMDNQYATTGNWSISPAADANTAAMGYPRNLSGHTSIAVFNGGATVTLPTVTAFYIQEIRVQSGIVDLNSPATANIEIGFDGVGLNISSGARLNIKGAFGVKLLMNASANNCTISGTLDLAGTGSSSNPPKLEKPNFVNPVWTVASGGKIILSGTNSSVVSSTSAVLKFLSGSSLEVTRVGGTVPAADYQSGSSIKITGNTTGITAFATSSVNFNGDIEWNCPLQTSTGTSASASLSSLGGNQFGGTFTMKAGFLLFQGTLNGTSYFTNINVQGGTLAFRTSSSTVNTLAINGNIDVSGGTFVFNADYFSSGNGLTTTVGGNITQTGGTIDVASQGTGNGNVSLKGNLNQTAGTITKSGSSTLSTIAFTGTATQSATLAGTITGSNLAFVINNASNNVNLLSNATLPYRLQCTSGSMILGNNNLTVTEKVLGTRTSGGVVTNGTGSLTLKNVDAGLNGKNFPVRFSNTSHDPVFITNTTGMADFTVRVSNVVTPSANLNFLNLRGRQWEITSTSTSANLEFEPDPAAGAPPAAGMRSIARYNGSAWVQSAAVDGANNGYPYSADFTVFTSFVVGATSVIPVELVNFKAKYTNNSNTLTWQTASERNAQQFDIQRSADGVSEWTTIGTVKANGNSQAVLNYQFADETPLQLSYYRLRTLDFDGKAQVSKTVSINRKANGKLSMGSISSLYTEGGTLTFDINLTERANLNISLTDVAGRTVLTKNYATVEGNNQIQLNTTGLAKGVYVINIADGQTSVAVKMVKQ